MLNHIVMFKLTDEADAPEAVERLRAMNGQIPSLLRIRCGTNSRPGDYAKDVVLISEHEDLAGLQAYIDHPAHQELLTWLGPRIAERCAVDSIDFG